MVIRYGDVIGVQSNAVEKKNQEEQGKARKGKTQKKWDYEGIVLENTGSFKYHICLTPECNPFVSWDFFIKNLKSIELGHSEEYTVINFVCAEKDCIVPTGYVKGGRYDLKNDLQFIIKDEKKGKQLVDDLNKLKVLEWAK